jgi:hypothetical protein
MDFAKGSCVELRKPFCQLSLVIWLGCGWCFYTGRGRAGPMKALHRSFVTYSVTRLGSGAVRLAVSDS